MDGDRIITKGVNPFSASIDYGIWAIMKGNAYTTLLSHALASAEVGTVIVTTPSDVDIFMNYRVQAPFEFTLESYSTTTYTLGTPLNIRNRNLASAKTSGLVGVFDATVSNDGTLIDSTTYGSAQKAGGEFLEEGFILPRGVTLMFKLISGAASNNIVTRVNFIVNEY